jgi:hypothetical protein
MGNHVACEPNRVIGSGDAIQISKRPSQQEKREIMRIGRGVLAAGITIAAIGASVATAGAAAAAPPTFPTVIGEINSPHTFILAPGEVVVVGETLHPNAAGYQANVPVLAVTTNSHGVTTVTTGYTFLPVNRIGVPGTTFTVIPPIP